MNKKTAYVEKYQNVLKNMSVRWGNQDILCTNSL